jgi:1-acyl-sn-glycerol-3-phosphate acyltransferase
MRGRRLVGALFLRAAGWRVEGALPAGVAHGVFIAAPHTSNWDLPYMLAVSWVLGVQPSWLGKRELFRRPFGGVMRLLGGLAVDRSKRSNVVEQVAALFARTERLFLVVPPSGTRSRAAHWKSGFYHIARTARVPLVCTFLDYGRKVGGIGPVFVPTGDLGADMDRVRLFYREIRGKYPEQETPVRLAEEDAAA